MIAEIVEIVNTYSPLVKPITLKRAKDDQYLALRVDGRMIACVRIEKVSWYEGNISHLVVAPEYRRQGLGRRMVERACKEIRRQRGRVAQATIREDNKASQRLFTSLGFVQGVSFIGPSGRRLGVWQKSL